MITREEALALLDGRGVREHLLQHSLASEAVLRGLAEHFGEDAELWSRTGLLHDLDYPATESCPERHGLEGAEILKGQLPEEALQAIRAHNSEHNGTPVRTRFDVALRCGETVTGLVTAAALVRPTGIAGMEVKSLKKKLKDKAFAAGVSRDIVRSCPDMGLTLEEFLGLAIAAMTAEAGPLGLLKESA
ncbi:MAG: HDIG domain-containing protein [Desulfovibrionaceae bacterium]|nr:HDIG domain-containing protein [Desulfovibrionaceae bacterium]